MAEGGSEPADESTEAADSFASSVERLVDRLRFLGVRALGRGRVRASVERIERDGSAARARYRLPGGTSVTESFDRSEPARGRSRFVRVVEGLGCDPGKPARIEGESIVLERRGGRWRAAPSALGDRPRRSTGAHAGATEAILAVGLGATALYLVLVFAIALETANVVAAAFAALMLGLFVAIWRGGPLP